MDCGVDLSLYEPLHPPTSHYSSSLASLLFICTSPAHLLLSCSLAHLLIICSSRSSPAHLLLSCSLASLLLSLPRLLAPLAFIYRHLPSLPPTSTLHLLLALPPTHSSSTALMFTCPTPLLPLLLTLSYSHIRSCPLPSSPLPAI